MKKEIDFIGKEKNNIFKRKNEKDRKWKYKNQIKTNNDSKRENATEYLLIMFLGDKDS